MASQLVLFNRYSIETRNEKLQTHMSDQDGLGAVQWVHQTCHQVFI